MKRTYLLLLGSLMALGTYADVKTVSSPDGRTQVNIKSDEGQITYDVTYDGKQMLLPSALGLVTDMGDYTQGLTVTGYEDGKVDENYTMSRTKASSVHYEASTVTLNVKATNGHYPMKIIFQVSNNNIAYRYFLAGSDNNWKDEPRRTTVLSEASAFRFPDKTTTFICPQTGGKHQGWMSTKPSYEEEYKADALMTEKSQFGHGYTFPCLFHVGEDGWVLVSECRV